jgi:sortase B
MSAVCGVMAYTAKAPESEVRLRWINDENTALGAELNAGGIKVYIAPNDPKLAPRMLRYVGWALGQNQVETRQSANMAKAKPAKRKSLKKNTARRLKTASAFVLVAAILAAVGSGAWLINYGLEGGRNQRNIAALAERFHNNVEPMSYGEDNENERLARFAELYAENNDIVGWLNIPGAGVDLPVMQAGDDEYYLTRDFERNTSRYGSLFLDTRNEITPGQESRNMSIFGHHTRSGSMFGQLRRYRDVAFYRENPTFTFSTLYREAEWVIFAVLVSNADPRQDNGRFFDWREPEFDNPSQMEYFLNEVHARSMIDTGIDVRFGDSLINLTTCCYDFRDARLIVFAREIRPGEEIDVSGATAIRDFRRPAAWRR